MNEITKKIEDWWPALPESVRAELLANLDREPLSADAVVSITRARGSGPAAAELVGEEPAEKPRLFLKPEDYQWISSQSGPF
ncbi:hypothetical protein C5C00_13120 [Rathayibacter rathayi]|uniref:hypothetical protein n=1 Tax=Rathayibacter rathayi TaxID=33887 RepID=UPI000CE7557A|nr:hypothetical protein [Rathayibacter rathayi]PPG85559.1 hypothetical protein C5C47_13435 [Rathayibacter rathayi]PPG93876.1 hypothetical protein C5C00_13120 [Rathayibacter rathayi]